MRCDRCAIAHLGDNGLCPIFNADMYGHNGCPMYCKKLNPCGICGRHIMGDSIIEQDDQGNFHQICVECSKASKCNICANTAYCRFNNINVHPEVQPYVMKVVRQGSMTMQRQEVNEKRIEVICTECLCYNPNDKENYCCKQTGGCKNYKVNWRN